jgi:hypothetical protein
VHRLPAALLVLTCVTQVVLVRTSALTPWKGGGFGMFATLDHSGFRRVSVVVEADERSEQVDIAPSLQEAEARAAACPSDRLLGSLAAGIAARERRYDRPVSVVRLTVWRTHFDPSTLHASEQTLRTFVYRTR